MKNILKPASRLIVVFILTMVISGGILTYLSINSISNFRELTEKKVAEEQLFIADQISTAFQQNLVKVADQFNALILPEDELDWDAVKHSDSLEFVEYPFIINPAGEFLWPWFLKELTMATESNLLPLYNQNIEIAQRNEFQLKDFGNAALYYSKSLKYSSGKSDSARSTNAVARVHMKMKDFTTSYSYYSSIVSGFASVLDNSGFPYVYYAIFNLLEICESDNPVNIIPEIGSLLEGIISGTVPINSSTPEILSGITYWMEHSGELDSSKILEMDETIRMIDRKLRFINDYSEILMASLEERRNNESQLQLGRFMVLNNPTEDPGKIVLIDPGEQQSPGFCMVLDSLWSGFMITRVTEETEFDYSVSLLRKELNVHQGNDPMVHYRLLSPYFPEYEIRIGLQDENLIDTFVQKRRWTYGIALILLLGAMLMGILLILRDILRERRLNQLRSDFVSNVTHELKTPLTSIHLFAESVLLDRVDSESGKKEYLQIILKETERLKRMINNILDFSKKEKGKIEYKSEKVDVTALIRSALNDLNYWLEELGFTVHTELKEGVCVSGDPDALKQVVINLLDNAIKYSGTQKEINISMVLGKDKIRIEFSDKGIGIPESYLDKIFDKFYRVNDNRVEGISGTGLGLTVVKEIIEAHHGEILVVSELNKGSKFTVVLDRS